MEPGRREKKRKGYFRFLQRMVEFYLSDANLRRDKFFKTQLTSNLEIELNVLLKCNRIAAVEASLDDLVTAIKPSKLVQLVGKDKLRRSSPVVEKTKEEVDRCTVYVERLPPDATHDWLTNIFSYFGHVAIVTMPRYKSNKMGYAFVEFENETACRAAVDKFTGLPVPPSCLACLPTTAPLPENVGNVEPQAGPAVSTPSCIADVREDEEPMKPEIKAANEDIKTQPVKKKKNRKKKKWQKPATARFYFLYWLMRMGSTEYSSMNVDEPFVIQKREFIELKIFPEDSTH